MQSTSLTVKKGTHAWNDYVLLFYVTARTQIGIRRTMMSGLGIHTYTLLCGMLVWALFHDVDGYLIIPGRALGLLDTTAV